MEPSETKSRDRPNIMTRVSGVWERWSAGILLSGGAVALTVGATLIYPPAGWITGGALAILGGILSAVGRGEEK